MAAGKVDDHDARLGARLRRLRASRGFTLVTLGAAVGVSFQQIQKYENGTNQMTVNRVRQIAEVLGVSPADLLDVPEPTTEAARLSRMFEGIKDIGKRREIMMFVEGLAS